MERNIQNSIRMVEQAFQLLDIATLFFVLLKPVLMATLTLGQFAKAPLIAYLVTKSKKYNGSHCLGRR